MKTQLKVFTSFSGYDSQCMALERLPIDYELIGWSEIDAHAIKAHDAIFPQWGGRNYGDISLIDWATVPDFDLFTYSSPCQDFSQAGLQKGGEKGSGTRSSLLWECEKAIAAKKPKYLLMENVAALVSGKFIKLFNRWQLTLENYGYKNFAAVLNAKDYGVPQNRERIFLVSILDESAKFEFPKPIKLQRRLKDVLESNVDEKYYLSDSVIDMFNHHKEKNREKGNGFGWNPTDGESYAQAIKTASNNRANDNYIQEPPKNLINRVIDVYPVGRERTEEEKKRRRKYGDKGAKFSGGKQLAILKDGVSGCVTAFATKDNLCADIHKEEPKMILGSLQDHASKQMINDNTSCPTIGTTDLGLPKLVSTNEPRPFNAYIDGTCRTIKAQYKNTGAANLTRQDSFGATGVIEPRVVGLLSGEKWDKSLDIMRRVYDSNGVAPTQHCCGGGNMETKICTPKYRIRKLTERECFRLMDVSDADIDKIQAAKISRTQQYKLAGNSIVVAVLVAIFNKMFVDTTISELKLFY